MTRIRVRSTIHAPADVVWARLADIAGHVHWMADARTIRFTGERRSGVGTRFECDTRIGPLRTTDVMEVTEWREGRSLGVRHSGIVSGVGRFVVGGGGPASTSVTWEERLRFPWWLGGPVAGVVAAPVLRRVWRATSGGWPRWCRIGPMAEEPRASRPHMPGYGTKGPAQGTGLLPWSWATERLTRSHDYWVATARPDGRPHVMPVWGVWWDDALWFSSGLRSSKARNLAADPRCAITTDNAQEPVVLEGTAAQVRDADTIRGFAERLGAKYESDYGVDFFDPDVNGTYRVVPTWAFGLMESDFEGSPTRWDFG